MQTFSGKLWLLPEYTEELNVEISLDEERIRVVAGRTTIGNWPLSEVDVELRRGYVFMEVEGEQIIVSSPDPGFAPALIGREVDELDEPYAPYEPPARGRHARRRRRWMSGLFRGVISRR